MAKPLRGYKRIRGTRTFRTPGGKTISESEYRTRRAKAAGFKNSYQQRVFREGREFRAWRFKALSLDQSADVGEGSDLEVAVREVDRLRNEGDTSTLNAPDGPLAQLLVASGARRDEWDWAVGDTPKGVRA